MGVESGVLGLLTFFFAGEPLRVSFGNLQRRPTAGIGQARREPLAAGHGKETPFAIAQSGVCQSEQLEKAMTRLPGVLVHSSSLRRAEAMQHGVRQAG